MEFLKKIPLFKELTEHQIESIKKISTIKKYDKGKTLFSPYDRAEFFFILKSGAVKVFKTSKGKEQIIRIFDKPNLFGEAASFTGTNFPAWAETIEDSEILLIPRKEFLEIIRNDPEIGMKLLSVMAQRLIHLTNVIESLSLKTALSKVSSYILRKYENEGEEINFSTGIAAMELGLTKETVSRMLSKLKKLGLIEKEGGRILIKNLNGLRDLAS
ncbi:transcriptional regulator, Crp/Fnr family [Balnearium lithotrophicum]|uniref:Transcriptional regulator, Crp/Fnr family n=1 Tax=Balnearium lithotrophicum TaxID=223788 RepID=A0A521DD76_9BACT|nr:Crp/Fnr family transcriptional regulator [Balnearium lithotrophicum]SMO69754.1 transcriptional regulator, Crp/Fnr family [Balnearium lithotrophicum]